MMNKMNRIGANFFPQFNCPAPSPERVEKADMYPDR